MKAKQRERVGRFFERHDWPLEKYASKAGVTHTTVRKWLREDYPGEYEDCHGENRERPARNPFKSRQPVHIYLYKEPGTQRYKLGMTTRILDRKHELRYVYGTKRLELVECIEGTADLERELKQIVAPYTFHGTEWFKGKKIRTRIIRKMRNYTRANG